MFGLVLYALVVAALGLVAAISDWSFGPSEAVLGVGMIAAWRYGWGLTNLVRSLIYRRSVFPRLRRRAERLGEAGLPSHVYLLVTSFRIDTDTTLAVYRATMLEAARNGAPTTVVASIVEMADQRLIKQLFASLDMPACVDLALVRIPGSGKRDAIAQGLRAIARRFPPPDSVVALIDGDTILEPDLLKRTLPFFKLLPKVDALTTDEICEVNGASIFRQWYNLRFAQRHISMSSVGLSRRVLTLTGRMSAFRAQVATDPAFIARIEHDSVDHWRIGQVKFLTGDDKSSWFHVLKSGREMLYVPDVRISTIETPPHPNFMVSATMLMKRWFGNTMRTNSRALALGPGRMGLFVWWSILDQRTCMWTTLIGPTAATVASVAYGWAPILAYGYWILVSRLIQTLGLLSARSTVSWTYPFLLFFNQIYGSLVKIYVIFRPDQQKWTRQNTVPARSADALNARVTALSSWSIHAVAGLIFLSLIIVYLGFARDTFAAISILLTQ